MKLTALGTGTCAATLRRSCSAYLIEAGGDRVLLDAGCGTIRRMMEVEADYREIDVIACSHTHPDHVADLAPLLMALRYTPGYRRTRPLVLAGPRGFSAFYRALGAAYGETTISADGYDLRIVELHEERLVLGGWSLSARTMAHSRQTNGYRIEHEGRVLAYSGDSGPCDALVELCAGADLALIECSFPDESPVEGHLTPSQAGRIAARAGCKKLLLTHFYPPMEAVDPLPLCRRYFDGEIEIAGDLSTYDV